MRLLIFSALLVALAGSSEAAWERPEIKFSEGIRANLRDKGMIPTELVDRFELQWPTDHDSWWRVGPFAEIRHNLDDGIVSRMELGGEIGVKPFTKIELPAPLRILQKPFSSFYLGNGFHEAWINPGRDHPEWEIRSVFSIPTSWKLPAGAVGLYALDEYTFDLDEGAGIRNEIGAGIQLPLLTDPFRLHLQLGWRHVDLVHELDNDQFEGALQAQF